MSAALLEGGYEDTVYGAVTFREADPTTGDFDYTVHVRQTWGVCCRPVATDNGGGGCGCCCW